MIWQRDHMLRRIYLNQVHTPIPSRPGSANSVGHYQANTLVVDTIGLLDIRALCDNYRTAPHQDLHVVERWKMAPDARCGGELHRRDPDLHQALVGRMRWQRDDRGPMIYFHCAENNAKIISILDEWPMPKPRRDF